MVLRRPNRRLPICEAQAEGLRRSQAGCLHYKCRLIGTRPRSVILAPKPANPLSLTVLLSGRYPRNRPRQTHCAYVACFHEVTLKKRPFFWKRWPPRCLPCPKSRRGVTGDPALEHPEGTRRSAEIKRVPERSCNLAWNQQLVWKNRNADPVTRYFALSIVIFPEPAASRLPIPYSRPCHLLLD